LIVEDEPEIAQLIQLSLERRFFLPKKPRRFECCRFSGPTGLDLLDLMVPGWMAGSVLGIRQKPGAKDFYILDADG